VAPRARIAGADALELGLQILAGEERGCRLRQDHRLALARGCQHGSALGLAGLASRGGREAANDERRDQEDRERDDVAIIGDREPVSRLDEEEVERDHAEDRGRDGGDLTATDRDEQDRQQVEDAETGHRCDLVEQGNEPRCDRHGDDDFGGVGGDPRRVDALWTFRVHRLHGV
jgi:hypothetical protein